MSNRDPVKILKPVAINNSLKGKRERWRNSRKWWTWNGTIGNSCYLCSPHQNLTNAFSFLSIKCWHFHPSFYDAYFKKSPAPGPCWHRSWQQMVAGDPRSLFPVRNLKSPSFSALVLSSTFGCIPVMPFEPESVQMFLAPSQLRSKPHAYCPELELPTPASIFSFCGKGVHKCITVPSEEFWQTFAH